MPTVPSLSTQLSATAAVVVMASLEAKRVSNENDEPAYIGPSYVRSFRFPIIVLEGTRLFSDRLRTPDQKLQRIRYQRSGFGIYVDTSEQAHHGPGAKSCAMVPAGACAGTCRPYRVGLAG